MAKRFAQINTENCVACGACVKTCPRNALSIINGSFAKVNRNACIGCGLCAKQCPTNSISIADN